MKKISNLHSKPVFCIEHFHSKENCSTQLGSILQNLASISIQEDGCLQYQLLIDDSDENHFILIVAFETAELMEQHEQQPHVVQFAENEMIALCDKFYWTEAKGI